jgi:V/A-type H+-transporting ATPase subunit E
MEMQLDSLIEKIKQEGISESKKKSEEILKQAEEKKKAVIQDAEEKAKRIIKQAEEQAAKLKDNSHQAIAQSVRDATLSLKQEINNLFDALLKKEIQRALCDDFIRELILRIIETLPKGKQAGLEISLSQQDKKRLEGVILSGLKKELTSGLTFKVNPNINKGLYIGIKDEDFHYDFTDQAILDILKEYLRPFIVKILDARS